jgi:hypothetical protein
MSATEIGGNMNKLVKFKQKYSNFTFYSSSANTPEFLQFAKEFKQIIISLLPLAARLIKYEVGHFYVYGFIQRGNGYVYFSIPDVRCKNLWTDDILVRTAQNEEDYHGGTNRYCKLEDFRSTVDELLPQEEIRLRNLV